MTGVGFALKGAETALKSLAQASERSDNPRGLYDNIGAMLVTSTQRRFEQGVAPGGSPWPPSMRALAEGGKTLIDRARLMQSITYQASDSGVEVGTNVAYAAIHQHGGEIKQEARSQVLHFKQHKRTGKMLPGFRRADDATLARKVEVGAHTITIPARPLLGVDADDEGSIERLAGDWLIGPQGAGDADR